MKKIILATIASTLFLSVFAQNSNSNSNSSTTSSFSGSTIENHYEFENETDEKEVIISVKDLRTIAFKFKGQIKYGDLLVTILDPEGKKEGGFQLTKVDGDGDLNTKKEGNSYSYKFKDKSGKGGAKGSMHKMLENPVNGDWTIRIEVTKVTGQMAFEVQQEGRE
jgi:hypothetical protein